MGNTVGEENHTQTVNEMPSHNHNYPGHWSESGGWNNGAVQMTDRGVNGYNNVGNTGGGQAFNVMQPTLFGGNYFIYAGQ
jgi:microcystin-dependent protein